jgi:hypothetical protein
MVFVDPFNGCVHCQVIDLDNSPALQNDGTPDNIFHFPCKSRPLIEQYLRGDFLAEADLPVINALRCYPKVTKSG